MYVWCLDLVPDIDIILVSKPTGTNTINTELNGINLHVRDLLLWSIVQGRQNVTSQYSLIIMLILIKAASGRLATHGQPS